MKTKVSRLIAILFFYNSIICATSLSFVNPTNGAVISNYYTDSQVAVNFYYYAQGSTGHYVKLITHDSTYSSLSGPIKQWFYLSTGTYTWKLELYEMDELAQYEKTAEQTITFYVKFKVSVHNNFSGGTINIDGSALPGGSYVYKYSGDVLNVGAIDQTDNNNYARTWNSSGTNDSYWKRKNETIIGAQSRNYSYTITSTDNGAYLTADLKKICNINFQNSLTGIGNGGSIYVNGTSYNSPTTAFSTIEGNPINVVAPYTIYNHNNGGLDYHFTQWSDGSGSASRTIYASQHQQYTANFNLVKPTNVGENISFGTTVGYPVKVMWAENPNTNVTSYQIWRMVNNGSPTLMATVGRGVLQFEDPEFLLNTWKIGTKLSYDVRAYYSVAGTYSDPTWADVYGLWYSIAENDEAELNKAKEIPKEFSVSNYPNPFNPTTTITYQLPEDGFVTLKVYDILGKEISELVNQEKSVGYYNVSFNAENLTSGIYLYSIKCNNYREVKKMLLAK